MADLFGFDELTKRGASLSGEARRTVPATPAPAGVRKTERPAHIVPLRSESRDGHLHPACEAQGKLRHEKAFVTDSAGGEITEGCEEHYFDRIVVSEDESFEMDRDTVADRLSEYVVMGEVLLNPRFKRRKF